MRQGHLVRELRRQFEQAKITGWTQHCEKHGTTHAIDFCFEKQAVMIRVRDCQDHKCPYHYVAAVPANDTKDAKEKAAERNRIADEFRQSFDRDLYWLRQGPGTILNWWPHEDVKDFVMRVQRQLQKTEKVLLKKAS